MVATVVFIGVIVGATPAHAASNTVSFVNGSIRYEAAPGQENVIGLSVILVPFGLPSIIVIDDVYAITVPAVRGGVCRHPVTGDRTLVHCDPTNLVSVIIEAGDGHDVIDAQGSLVTAHLLAEEGQDDVYTSNFLGVFTHVDGGDGIDHFFSGLGQDQFVGGPDHDLVQYETAASVWASLMTGTGGRSGEADTYAGIESLAGGDGDDVIIGDNGFNQLFGGGGDDQIFGNGGPDEIHADQPSIGPGGQDFVMGGDGNDEITGDDGSDMVFGEAGNDTIMGGPDKGAGWYDLANGGPGTDKCLIAPKDDWAGCENLVPTPH